MTKIDFLIKNQHQEYIIVFKKAKNNMPMILEGANITIYRDLTPYITLFTLLKIYQQYYRLVNKP